MQAIISPGNINGKIVAPASKSAMQRACALALLHKGVTIIHRPGISHDDKVAVRIIESLGAKVETLEDGSLKIISSGIISPKQQELNFGESGLSMRMFTSIASLTNTSFIIQGEGSLLKRPAKFFKEVLPQAGVVVDTQDDFLPVHIKGPLNPSSMQIDGSLSSQYLTGLLMALAHAAKQPLTLSVTNLKSRPYIDLTLAMMEKFGYNITNHHYSNFEIFPGNNAAGKTIEYTVEGDWSGASFLLTAAAIQGKVTVSGLDMNSAQADRAILNAMHEAGIMHCISGDSITVTASDMRPFRFNAVDCPDLFPPLVAMASYCRGKSMIEGVHRLKHKESNRAITLQETFGRFGVEITFVGDMMIIDGNGLPKGGNVTSHNDHRIAMAAAVTAIGADGNVLIENAECVNKSYPAFFEDLKNCGIKLTYG